jgi:hypothetical protein
MKLERTKLRWICLAALLLSSLLCRAQGESEKEKVRPPPTSGPQNGSQSKLHWAFEPIKKITPPSLGLSNSANPIDLFIQGKLRDQSLKAVPPAGKRTLIRRIYFDLIGLPPAPEEVEAFVSDESADAYLKLIERLLASPRYGERWGRHWMDVVRYADTAGDNADYPIPEARLYRDYIIDSFNSDKPYDQFVQEQIAGDILAKLGPREKYAEQAIATGFIALSRRFATAPFELMHLTLEDTVETTGRAFLGLTLRCARCHDHKYDPVTQEDYYALYGFFASTRYPYAGSEEFASKKFPRSGFVPLVTAEEAEPRIKANQDKIQALQTEIKQLEDENTKSAAQLKQPVDEKAQQVKDLEAKGEPVELAKKELQARKKQLDEAAAKQKEKLQPLRDALGVIQKPGLPPGLAGAYAVAESEPIDANLQVRGNPDEKGPAIKRALPKFLASGCILNIPDRASGRLELAQWMTRRDNPLTARVMVNRIWQHHFGKGIVATPSNFGLRGEEPTHPELIDYLAAYFVENGWSIKAMHRLILYSKTYQRGSSYDETDSAKDPANKFLWRFDRRRLDAEAIRDAILSATEQLDLSRPGEQPFPPIEKWNWTQHNPFKAVYESHHRSIYLMTQRLVRHPYLGLFDAPDGNTTTDVRTDSTVPLQALYLMNNKFVQDQSAAFGARLIRTSANWEERIKLGVGLAWSREPEPVEVNRAKEFLQSCQEELARAGATDKERELESWASYARVLLTANEFVYVD